MLSKILGFVDFATAVVIILFQYNIVPVQLVISLSLYLIIKAIVFFGDFMSILDGIVGLYMLLMFLFKPEVISIIFAVYLTIKGIWSIAS